MKRETQLRAARDPAACSARSRCVQREIPLRQPRSPAATPDAEPSTLAVSPRLLAVETKARPSGEEVIRASRGSAAGLRSPQVQA